MPARLFFRCSFRLARLALHLLKGVSIAGLVLPVVNDARRSRLICAWSAQLLKVLGVRLNVGSIPAHSGGALLVCNHVSWLDVYLIFAIRRVYFVSKSEVREWPVAGWLAHKSGTLFLERGRRADTARINHAMRALMQSGAWVAVFPEGTTSDGRSVKRFLPSLLQPAVDLGCPIVPAALRYRTLAGDYSAAPAYIDDMTILQSLMHIISEPGIVAELCFGESFMPDGHRRELAAQAESIVAGLLGAAASVKPDNNQ
ncbi:MAG: lysophospholipid acyltransferase family protein [Thiobacillaceae bacterium]